MTSPTPRQQSSHRWSSRSSGSVGGASANPTGGAEEAGAGVEHRQSVSKGLRIYARCGLSEDWRGSSASAVTT